MTDKEPQPRTRSPFFETFVLGEGNPELKVARLKSCRTLSPVLSTIGRNDKLGRSEIATRLREEERRRTSGKYYPLSKAEAFVKRAIPVLMKAGLIETSSRGSGSVGSRYVVSAAGRRLLRELDDPAMSATIGRLLEAQSRTHPRTRGRADGSILLAHSNDIKKKFLKSLRSFAENLGNSTDQAELTNLRPQVEGSPYYRDLEKFPVNPDVIADWRGLKFSFEALKSAREALAAQVRKRCYEAFPNRFPRQLVDHAAPNLVHWLEMQGRQAIGGRLVVELLRQLDARPGSRTGTKLRSFLDVYFAKYSEMERGGAEEELLALDAAAIGLEAMANWIGSFPSSVWSEKVDSITEATEACSEGIRRAMVSMKEKEPQEVGQVLRAKDELRVRASALTRSVDTLLAKTIIHEACDLL